MSSKLQHGSHRTIEHTVRILARTTTAGAHLLRSLDRVAQRDPTAVLGVLEFWLGRETVESDTRGDS